MLPSGGPDWSDLPLHLLDKVLLCLGGGCAARLDQNRTRSVLEMRLVCKAWRAACANYSGSAKVLCKQRNDLPAVCNMLPRLRRIFVQMPADGCMTALSSLSGLSNLYLTGKPGTMWNREFDLTCLQPSLKTLTLNVSFTFSHIRFVGLTSLSFWKRCNTVPELVGLLQHLPYLQVRDHPFLARLWIALSHAVIC